MDRTLTSFPKNGITDHSGEPPALSGIYNRMRSAIHNVIPSAPSKANSSLQLTDRGNSPVPPSDSTINPVSQPIPSGSQNSESPMFTVGSPVRYLRDAWPTNLNINTYGSGTAPIQVESGGLGGLHMAASPSVSTVTRWEGTEDDTGSGASIRSVRRKRGGSMGSLPSNYSGPHGHLPGFALASEDEGSDAESIASTYRDYMISQLTKKHKSVYGGLSKEFWMKDENVAECFRCGAPFTGEL